MRLDRETAEAARRDVGLFAAALIGQPLWPHQLDLARSTARIRCVCSGRQAGKSTTLAVLALHEAFSEPDRRVLIVSAGEAAALDLLAEASKLATSPLLAGSVVDDEHHLIVLSNGSSIRSVPASEKQIRGRAVDLLVIDEAAFVAEEVWSAAKFTVISRAGSRVVMSSTPWGRADRFFAQAYRAGQRGEVGYESFHWPSTASPMVVGALLAIWRDGSSEREYRREVLAEWVDAAGAYFADDELEAAIADYELIPPDDAGRRRGVAGVDWGFARDSSAVVVMTEARGDDLAGEWPGRTFWLPWIDEGVGVPYAAFVRRVASVAAGYRLVRIGSEVNGVGAMPTQELRRLVGARARVVEVSTTADSKQDGFGRLKVLMSQGRLALPRHPRLLAQLGALEFEERDSGSVRIAVPERAGHDDLAMALCLAVNVGDVTSRRGARWHFPTDIPDPRPPAPPRAARFDPVVPAGEGPVPVVDPETRQPRKVRVARSRIEALTPAEFRGKRFTDHYQPPRPR